MKKFLSLLCFFLLIAGFSFAQEFGAVKGKIVDEEGVALPGVSISLTGVKIPPMNTVTSVGGNFRFVGLPVSNDYVLKVELVGFKTVVREQLNVSFGRDIVLNLVLEQTALEESITVIGASPVIDVKRTQVGVNITDDMIMSLPSARNPWVIMAMVPGMLINKEDVGGNEAGQQSSYSGHGSVGADNTWSIDGASVTDNSALGAAPGYFNLASYEELQVTYGNNDVKSQTGGVQLNFVSKRGGNAYSGTFYLDVMRDAWQSSNITSELETLYPDGGYNPGVNRIYLYGANFGGPLVKDRAWFYGSWGIQDLDARNIDGSSDKTWLVSGYGKVNLQLGPSTRTEMYLQYDDKLKWGRLAFSASSINVSETSWNQDGPGYFWKGEVEQMFGNLYINAKAIWMDMSFYLRPQDAGKGKPLTVNYYPTYSVTGALDDYGTTRTNLNINVTGNYFAENVIGGDHEIKFGVDYVISTVTSYDYYEGNLYMYYYGPAAWATSGEYWEVEVKRDVNLNNWMKRYSFFVQDTMTLGKLAINLGLRYDVETSMVKDQKVPASPFLSNLLPALTIEKLDPGISWTVFSPRIAFIYDLTGDGKNVFKLNLARYGSQEGFGMAGTLNPMGWGGVGVYWDDLNGDDVVTNNELFGEDAGGNLVTPTAANILWAWGVNVDDPTDTGAANKIDPDFNSPLLDELTFSFERELMTDFAIRAEFYYKKSHGQIWNKSMKIDGTLETKDNYYADGTETITGAALFGRTASGFYYDYKTNYPNRYTRYLAGQIVLLKRLSNRWMLNASFTYSDWNRYYKGDYQDPQNLSYYDKGVNSWMNSRWQLKCSGMYQFPFGLNTSWVFRAREGYILENYVRTPRTGIGQATIRGGLRGDNRLPAFYELDFRLEKTFQISDTAKVTFGVDAFNAFNSATELELGTLMTDATWFGKTRKVLNPRVFRFGIRFDF